MQYRANTDAFETTPHYKGVTLLAFFMVSFLSLGLGLSLFLVKSPESKAAIYKSMAADYVAQSQLNDLERQTSNDLIDQAQSMLVAGITLSPYDAGAWTQLSEVYAGANNINKAMRARTVAATLGAENLPTINALKSMLPERNLALSSALPVAPLPDLITR